MYAYFKVFLKKKEIYLYKVHTSYVQLEILESERADPCCEDEHMTLSYTRFLAVEKISSFISS